MVSRECIFRIPCQLISVRLFFFVCVLLNTMHLFGMKNAFFKVGTIYAWVCRANLCSNQRSLMALLSAIFKILHISSSILFMIYVHLASGKCNQKYFYVYFNSMSSFVSLLNDLNNAMHFFEMVL